MPQAYFLRQLKLTLEQSYHLLIIRRIRLLQVEYTNSIMTIGISVIIRSIQLAGNKMLAKAKQQPLLDFEFFDSQRQSKG